jgi:hypothetical protein
MLKWLQTKLHEKKTTERMERHIRTAKGPNLHRLAIAVTMTALEDDLLKEELQKVRADQKDVFLMTYECLIMWAILNGVAAAGVPEATLDDLVNAIRDHLADHGFYKQGDFEKLWEQTYFWMPQFAKPTRDGNYYPAAAFVQVPGAAGLTNSYGPGYTFGTHFANLIQSMTDIGASAGKQHQELWSSTPNLAAMIDPPPSPGSALEAAIEASTVGIVNGYRKIAELNNIPPSRMTSDAMILEIYSRVMTAFKDTAEQRGEHIPAVCVNKIVLKFLCMYEKMPAGFWEEHLDYEIKRYKADGLRPDYKEELHLF